MFTLTATDWKSNKKILLRERKRHTARRVLSTPYVVLTGYPPQPGYPPAGYPPGRVPPHPGYPPGRVPPQPRYPQAGYPPPPPRVPPPGYPPRLDLAGYPPPAGPGRVPPPRLDLAGYPPVLPHGILGNVAKHYGIRVPPPPPRCEQTENITFPHPSDAGGNYTYRLCVRHRQYFNIMSMATDCLTDRQTDRMGFAPNIFVDESVTIHSMINRRRWARRRYV